MKKHENMLKGIRKGTENKTPEERTENNRR
jgi:hypothetical protein